jgi:hypothetical protein
MAITHIAVMILAVIWPAISLAVSIGISPNLRTVVPARPSRAYAMTQARISRVAWTAIVAPYTSAVRGSDLGWNNYFEARTES